MGYMSMGRACFFSHEHEKALKYLNQGLKLNPNYAYCHAIKGIAAGHAGSSMEALHHLKIAERLSPFDSLLFAMKMAEATALIRQGKFVKATEISLLASSYPNAFFSTFALTATCLQLIGRTVEASEYVKKALQMNPTYSVEAYMQFLSFSEDSTKRLISNAMQEAGMPLTNKYLLNDN
jgi:tetratricopeptide (TPR) repeat protein